jgi:hypothetical protein
MLTAFRRAADVVHRLFNGKEQAHPLSLEAYQEDLVELLKNVLQERGTKSNINRMKIILLLFILFSSLSTIISICISSSCKKIL